MTRLLAAILLFCCCSVVKLYADPAAGEARRVQLYHDRLQTIGTGNVTAISVFLRDGEALKGTIDYLNPTEVGIRDEFGHLRPVPLKGIVEFTARNRKTGVKTASTNRWRRATRLLWRRVNGVGFDAFSSSFELAALL